jgi:prepilin-type N-terminal cleavage/methylation domain-containing protein
MKSAVQGVSLMELMIVVAIIAIIAMATYPAFTGYIQKGYDTEAIEEISSLEVLLAQYLIDNGTYTSAADTTAIKTNYGWEPATAKPSFDYDIKANSGCPSGVSVCYTVTATGKDGTPVANRTIVKTSWGALTTGGVVIR